MDGEKIKELEVELSSAITVLKTILAQAQNVIGGVDVLLYLIKKASAVELTPGPVSQEEK